MRRAQESGEIRADLDPGAIAQVIVGTYLAAVMAAGPGALPVLGREVDQMVDMLFRGIAGPNYRGPEEA